MGVLCFLRLWRSRSSWTGNEARIGPSHLLICTLTHPHPACCFSLHYLRLEAFGDGAAGTAAAGTGAAVGDGLPDGLTNAAGAAAPAAVGTAGSTGGVTVRYS